MSYQCFALEWFQGWRGTGAEAHLGCHPNASLKACSSTVGGYSNYGTAIVAIEFRVWCRIPGLVREESHGVSKVRHPEYCELIHLRVLRQRARRTPGAR